MMVMMSMSLVARTLTVTMLTSLSVRTLTQAATPAIPAKNRPNRRTTPQQRRHADPKPDVKWEELNFSLNGVQTDFMWLQTISAVSGQAFSIKDNTKKANNDENKKNADDNKNSLLVPWQTLQLSPAATVLNYGQALFEGMKAFRRVDGTIALFRPENNARRMEQGAERFLLPSVPTSVFTEAAHSVVRANAQWIPPVGMGALYLRPLLMGTGALLGVKPSTEATFCIYASPVGNYFKGDLKPIRLQAVKGYSRAAPGGGGCVKASGNYAPAFAVQSEVRKRGYDEVLCLDAVSGEAVEEAGASNFFVVFPNRTVATPSLSSETILPGVTRQSIIELAQNECGCTVVEQGRITLDDLEEACEAFCCGTGAVITPVSCVSVWDGQRETRVISFGDNKKNDDNRTVGPLTRKLYEMLTGIQSGANADLAKKYAKWIDVVKP